MTEETLVAAADIARLAMLHSVYGWLRCFSGRPEESLEYHVKSIRLADETGELRLRVAFRGSILHALWDDEVTVGEIIEAVGGLQANVSKHLGVLQQAGLVSRRKEGLRVFYRIADPTVFELCEVVCESLHGVCTPSPQRPSAVSIASMTPSSARPLTTRPSPSASTAWWW